MKALLILAALALAGCSSFNVGSFCYVHHGTNGQCTITTIEPAKPARGDL